MFPSKKSSKQISSKLFVGNLATQTTSLHLQTIFHTHGQIVECVKVRERYGFVRFSTNDQAQRALNACNGLQLHGYPMIVEYAQNEILISPKSPRIYHSKRDDIPILSNLNPDASSFTYSTSDYYSQSDRPSSRSSSSLSATLPIFYSDDDADIIHEEKISSKNISDQRSSLNIFIGDKILHRYKTNQSKTCNSFDGRDIDPRDPIFIWNFAFYPDVSISPFLKRSDINHLLERRVLLYS